MRLKFVFIFIICCSLFSCNNEQPVFDQYHSINGNLWESSEEISFTFEIEDNTIPYDVTLKVRNNAFYPYQSLWISWKEYKDEELIKADTTEFRLADEYGNWLGKGFSLFHSSRKILSNHKFKETGEYFIRVSHDMQDRELKGIEDLGLRVDRTKN